MNTSFSIEGSLRHAWELFKVNKRILILSTIIFMVIGGIGKSHHGHQEFYFHPFSIIIMIAFYILTLLVQIGFFKMLLKIEDGHTTHLEDLFKYAHLIFDYFIAYLLFGLVVMVGFVFLIVPGVYALFTYGFVPLLTIDKGLGVGEAFTESARMTKGHKWHLIGFGLVCILINLLGAMVLFVGLLFTIPLTLLAYAHVYRTLSKHHHSAPAQISEKSTI